MLTENDKKDLKCAMRAAILDESRVVTENVVIENYVKKEATYEQLLNICFNENRDNVYLESNVLEDFATNYVLEMVYGGQEDNKKQVLESSIDKYEMLENVLYEADGSKISGMAKKAGSKVKSAGKKAGEQAKKYGKKAGEMAKKAGSKAKSVGKKAGEKAKSAGKKAGKMAKKAGEATKEYAKKNPKKAAGIAAGTLATTAGAWYIYRKLRKAGADKKKAAVAAAQAAQKKANKTKAPADIKAAKKWKEKARKA